MSALSGARVVGHRRGGLHRLARRGQAHERRGGGLGARQPDLGLGGVPEQAVCRGVVARDAGIAFSISHTTRAMRPGEQNGLDYHFVSQDEFRRLVAEGAFVEHAEYADNLYGTSWKSLDAPLAAGRDLLLEVDVQGALQLRERRRDARFVFLLPPSREELERRLRGRGTDAPDAIARRLAAVDAELQAVHAFDYAIVNDDVERASEALLAVIAAERAGDTAAVRARWDRARVVASLAHVLPIPPR